MAAVLRTISTFVAVLGVIAFARHASASGKQDAIDRSLIDQYCITCHNTRLMTAGLSLETVDLTKVEAHAEILEKVIRKLRAGQMPPVGRPRPPRATVDAFATALELALDQIAAISPNPGRRPVHRLNRLEYINAVQDLLNIDVNPSWLPVDSAGIGFDNNADILSVTPALMARYLSAAAKISRLAVGNPAIRPAVQVYSAPEFSDQSVRMGDDFPFGTHGGIAARHIFPLDGMYTLTIRLQRNSIGDTIRGIDNEHEIEIRIDHDLIERFTVGGKYPGHDIGLVNGIPDDDVVAQNLHTYRLTADDHLEIAVAVKAGTHLVTTAFTDRAPAVSELVPLRPSSRKRRIFTDDAGHPNIETLSIDGPYAAIADTTTPSQRRVFVCRPAAVRDETSCARSILENLAQQAYRRPITAVDIEELMPLYHFGRQTGTFETGIEVALEGLLSSLPFLFSLEHDPVDSQPGTVYSLTDMELASRLSLFLWKSLPDDALLASAVENRLGSPTVLADETRRMLSDPKATRWINDFTEQWLTVRNLNAHEPDPDRFPDFDDNLRAAMATETRLFFESQVRQDQSVLDLLRADYTFLNERLARHYDIPGVYGSHFRRVSISDPTRRGLLGHASILTVTSYADRTSVVLRGKWVLETLLGAPPPPPPPNVPDLEDIKPGTAPRSLRERMEQHRESPVCASCHAPMDPFGFVLENFDATGRWRNTDAGATIDTTTSLIDGSSMAGPEELHGYLLNRRDEFLRTVVEKLMAYALGRSLEYFDAPAVRKILRDSSNENYRWSSIIDGVVKSEPFRMRRVSDETDPQQRTQASHREANSQRGK